MAGNENETLLYLVKNLNRIELNHLGIITRIETPVRGGGLFALRNEVDVLANRTEDSRKKADVIINGHGVSLKQEGPCFPYNRLQRAELLQVFQNLHFENPQAVFNKFDEEVDAFNSGRLEGRSRPWEEFLTEEEFYKILHFLMMVGSPNVGVSPYQAEFIMESPKKGMSADTIKVFTFDEYFNTYKDKLKVAIRRSWYGQLSHSEHTRACSLMEKRDNLRWVYSDFTGEPRPDSNGKQWRTTVAPNERKAAYYIMMEKK